MNLYYHMPEFLNKLVFRYKIRQKRRELALVVDHTDRIGKDDILLICVLRNEKDRIPYFLDYYRQLGVNHFLFIDNESDDGFRDYVSGFEDCSVWLARGSYRKAKSGTFWINALLGRYGVGRWCVVADPDEFLVFPDCETRNLHNLAAELDRIGKPHLFTFLLDMYSGGPVSRALYREKMDPLEVCPFFDGEGYLFNEHPGGHIWVKGGVRRRLLFRDDPDSPTLNKYPFVKWQKGIYYFASTHAFLPLTFGYAVDRRQGSPTGCLLHFKFFSDISEKAREEMHRRQHAKNGWEYERYASMEEEETFYDGISVKYVDSKQLVEMGLMADSGKRGMFENHP